MGEHAALVKFGEHDHLIQLREEGILYMNTFPHFWEVEDEELRGDPFDSIAEVARGKRADVKLPNGEKLPVEVTDWTLRMHPPYPEKINIFCMYALRPAAYGKNF